MVSLAAVFVALQFVGQVYLHSRKQGCHCQRDRWNGDAKDEGNQDFCAGTFQQSFDVGLVQHI